MEKKYFLFLLLAIAANSFSQNTQSKQLFKCSNKLGGSYGIIAHVGARYKNLERPNAAIKSIVDIGVDFVRCDYYWKIIQPTARHHKDYTHLDSLMVSIKKHDLSFLPILDYTIDDYKDIWNHIDEWGGYVDNVVDRYREYNDYWEVWNEENLSGFWSGNKPSAKQYLGILRKASSIIRHKDPSSKVVLGGLAGIGCDYLEDLLKIGGSKYFDVVNIHYYNPHKGPEIIIDELYELKNLLNKYQVHKEVWLTETGYSTYPSSGMDLKGQVDEEQQAIWLPRTFLTVFSYGIEKVFWYCHMTGERRDDREEYFGIVHNDFSPKPAYYAYKTIIQMCPDKSSRPQMIRKGDIFLAKWKRPDGKKVWAIWAWKDNEKSNLLIKGKYKVFDLYGKEVPYFNNINAHISPSITYLVGAKEVRIK